MISKHKKEDWSIKPFPTQLFPCQPNKCEKDIQQVKLLVISLRTQTLEQVGFAFVAQTNAPLKVTNILIFVSFVNIDRLSQTGFRILYQGFSLYFSSLHDLSWLNILAKNDYQDPKPMFISRNIRNAAVSFIMYNLDTH